jgi:hypothetical protein
VCTEDTQRAADLLAYFRSALWHAYPKECEAYLDQRANDKEPFSVTLLPEDKIAENLVRLGLTEA